MIQVKRMAVYSILYRLPNNTPNTEPNKNEGYKTPNTEPNKIEGYKYSWLFSTIQYYLPT